MRGSIQFEGVWKKFRRGMHHDSLRDLVPALSRGLLGRPRSKAHLYGREFWAVRDVSFEVVPGQALGIIGPNGAGKSTILKLLTSILRPTRGSARVEGRIGALIEIAAGFHPDLTGRENIYLQGAMMGMRRREIAEKFDAIVEFAALPSFIDTQVKRYSSGMNARLGFAIAAHLDPDVLIIDEVLSVGDYAFQRKAFDRLREMTQREIPVVIVSHQLERIATLCSEAILLDAGRVRYRGDAGSCVQRYVEGVLELEQGGSGEDCPLRIRQVRLRPDDHGVTSGEPFQVVITGEVVGELPPQAGVCLRVLSTQRGEMLCAVNQHASELGLPRQGPFEIVAELEANLPGGFFTVDAAPWDAETGKVLARRVHTALRVEHTPGLTGVVNLHPRLRVTRGGDEYGVAITRAAALERTA
jgi:ABC-type polysaccharide/polyol phosphate transport system ATPase subunit